MPSTVDVGEPVDDENPDYLVDQWTIQSRVAIDRTVTETVRVGWKSPVLTSSTTYGTTTNGSLTQYSSTNYTSLESRSANAARPADTAWANNGAATTTTGTTINGSGQQVVTVTQTQPEKQRLYECRLSSSRYRINYRDYFRNKLTYNYQTSDPITETRTRTEFDRFEYRPVVYDVSLLKAFQSVTTRTGDLGTNETSSWDGCIEEQNRL